MLDTTELGLGESQQLNAVGRGAGMLIGGTEGICRGMDAALMWEPAGELVEANVLQVILRSSIGLREGAAEVCS